MLIFPKIPSFAVGQAVESHFRKTFFPGKLFKDIQNPDYYLTAKLFN